MTLCFAVCGSAELEIAYSAYLMSQCLNGGKWAVANATNDWSFRRVLKTAFELGGKGGNASTTAVVATAASKKPSAKVFVMATPMLAAC